MIEAVLVLCACGQKYNGPGVPAFDSGSKPSHIYLVDCVHLCLHTYIHTYIHTITYIYIMYKHTSNIHIHQYYVHNIHAYIHTCIHTYIQLHIYIYILCISILVTYIYIKIMYIHKCIHTYKYIYICYVNTY